MDSGETLTKAQVLARLIWKRALGYTEVECDKKTNEMREVKHPPEVWAIQLVYERLEGKVQQAAPPESSDRPTAAQRVSMLSAERINNLISTAAPASGPPPLPSQRKSNGDS
jgi:hypothetical protein